MPAKANTNSDTNPLPNILQTPAGLAILEIQGSLNSTLHTEPGAKLPVGKLDFPLYDSKAPASDTTWQKRVHLYVGKHQRLTGEVKKLPQALAVLRKVPSDSADEQALEVAEIIYYKVLLLHALSLWGPLQLSDPRKVSGGCHGLELQNFACVHRHGFTC